MSPLIFSGIGAADGAVRVSTHDMPETYWSVSVFDADTNNFYALNDRQAKSGAADFILMPRGKSAGTGQLPVVVAPTSRGIVLFRTLVMTRARLPGSTPHVTMRPVSPLRSTETRLARQRIKETP